MRVAKLLLAARNAEQRKMKRTVASLFPSTICVRTQLQPTRFLHRKCNRLATSHLTRVGNFRRHTSKGSCQKKIYKKQVGGCRESSIAFLRSFENRRASRCAVSSNAVMQCASSCAGNVLFAHGLSSLCLAPHSPSSLYWASSSFALRTGALHPRAHLRHSIALRVTCLERKHTQWKPRGVSGA